MSVLREVTSDLPAQALSPPPWFLLQSGPGDPAWNMALDEALLEAITPLGRPVLRFYAWEVPAATFGYFQRFADVVRMTPLRPLVRRPTGGGLVLHDADWTYSLVFPPGHEWYALRAVESYRRLHEWIRASFEVLGVASELSPCCQKEIPGQCFIGAEKYDLLSHGRKIAGAAQRRSRQGLLIQGSIQPPSRSVSRATWERAFCDAAGRAGDVGWTSWLLPAAVAERARALAVRKYGTHEYNERR